MTIEEKNQIINILNGFTTLNIEELVVSHFQLKDEDVATKQVLGPHTGASLIKLIKKIIANLKLEINSDGWSSLPSHVNHHDFGTRHLSNDLQALLNQLNSRTFDGNLIVFMEYIIYYQRVNNFWHKSELNIKIENVNEIENLIISKNQAFQNSLNEYNTLKSNVERLSTSFQ